MTFFDRLFKHEIVFFFFAAREMLPQWDKQIQSLCYQVNSIIELISKAQPDWIIKVMEEQMVS